MPPTATSAVMRLRLALGAVMGGPQALAFLPALTLAAFWLGGEAALLATALILPALVRAAAALGTHEVAARDPVTGLPPRRAVVEALDRILAAQDGHERGTACLALDLEGLEGIAKRHGPAATETALAQAAERLSGALRGTDVLARLNEARFAIALGPMPRADLGALLQTAHRLQNALADPVTIGDSTVPLTCSIGLCLPERSPAPGGSALLEAAETALQEGRRHGPAAVRAFSREMQVSAKLRSSLVEEVAEALENGQIRPWFQPQSSTDTGAVTGFEALPRWSHPEYGLIPPAGLLPVVEQAGLSVRLGEKMLTHSLAALRSWDHAGLPVPSVGLNFSGHELRNPRLAERIFWELDRFGLAPERLTIEILETVLTDGGDDIIARNIRALAQRGCRIDLDEFGTGHISLAAIRRFAVNRLKIDRCFITRIDADRAQQEMVSAILMMCGRLGLDTLATGVERAAEHAMLAQLGVGHVQGRGIGRPMPFEDTPAWIRKHDRKLGKAASLGKQAGSRRHIG